MDHLSPEKESPRRFKPDFGRTITYGLPVFVGVHALGMFLPPFDQVWHLPLALNATGAFGIGFVIHYLVFTFGPSKKKEPAE